MKSGLNLIELSSVWNDPKIVDLSDLKNLSWPGGLKGEERPNDYRIEFGNSGVGDFESRYSWQV